MIVDDQTSQRKFIGFGLAGVLFGFLAIAIAVFQNDLRPPEPGISDQVKTSIFKKSKALLGIGDDSAPAPVKAKKDVVKWAYMGAGLLAFMLGVTAYLRHENSRVSGMAGALGIIAIAWEYVLIAVVIAVVIYFLANLDL